QKRRMIDSITIFAAAVFVAAGLVKGVIGLGLPTIAMGMLALAMPPLQAAALLVVPSLVTNVWQALAGPFLAATCRRLWPLLLGVCLGTWAGMGLMRDGHDRIGPALLGAALALYALSGLLAVRLQLAP